MKLLKDPETGRVRRSSDREAEVLEDYGWIAASESEERAQERRDDLRGREVRP